MHRLDHITRDTDAPDAFAGVRAVMDVLPVGVALIEVGEATHATTMVKCNAAYARIVGGEPRPGSEIRALPYVYFREDRTTPLSTSEWPGDVAITTGQAVPEHELHVRRADGEWRVVVASAAPIRQGDKIRGAVVCSRDITMKKELEQALVDAKQVAERHLADLQAVLDAVPAAVFITHDRDASLMQANRGCAEMLRVPKGTNVSKTAPPDQVPRTFRVMKDGAEIPATELPVQLAASSGVEVRDYEFDFVFEDGTAKHMFGNAAPLRGPSGEPAGAVGAFVDISDRVRAEAALREADRRKDEFLAVLSHELRNPLAPIRNSVSILEHDPANEERVRRATTIIGRQVTQLTRLVDDLLDVNRISHGKVHLRLDRVELRDLVQRVVEDHRSILAARDIQVRLDVGRQVWVRVDAARIAQVLGNLLHNAAKFTDPGGHVLVRLDEPAASGFVSARVRDSGQGIAPGMEERIFQPFAQAFDPRGPQHGGLGLGLALVKGLVELHGGKVTVSSDGVGRGAEFAFTLPLDATQPAEERRPETPPRPVVKRNIVVIEDNHDGAESLRDILELIGHEVHVAYTGATGIAAAIQHAADVVLCDIGLPDMNGRDVARALKQTAGFNGRLVALTGYASPDDERLAAEAGFDHHLPKPADLDRLTAILDEA